MFQGVSNCVEEGCFGILSLDQASVPKWKLGCNKCDVIVRYSRNLIVFSFTAYAFNEAGFFPTPATVNQNSTRKTLDFFTNFSQQTLINLGVTLIQICLIPKIVQKISIQCPLDIATLDIAAALALATSTSVTNLRKYINSDLGWL